MGRAQAGIGPESTAAVRFGAFLYRPDGTLVNGDTRINLPPKESRLLALLLEHRGEIVSHADIEAAVWPRQQISYASMARLVHSLRRALSADRADYIETVPKRGYRLVAPSDQPCGGRISSAVLESVTTDSRTYATFLEGKRHANGALPQAQAHAAELMQAALDRDPQYLAAAIALAETRMYQSLRGYLPPKKALRLGQRACRLALSVDRDHVPAQCLDAWFDAALGGDLSAALARIARAIEADPDYAPGLVCQSFLLRAAGLLDEGVAAAEKAYTLDPFTLITSHALAWSLFCNGRAPEALSIEQTIAAESPDLDVAQANRAIFAAYVGDFEEAHRACDRLLAADFVAPVMRTGPVYVWAQEGNKERALLEAEGLAAEGLPRAPRPHLAAIHAAAGDDRRAAELLRQARAEHCPWYLVAHADPRLQGLHTARP